MAKRAEAALALTAGMGSRLRPDHKQNVLPSACG